MANIPAECLRSDEEIERRKQRADLYKELRAQNDKTRKDEELDDVDDFFGGGSEKNRQPLGKGGSVNVVLKKVKSVYSKLASLNASNVDSQVQSLKECNLSHFIEETALNLMNADIKMADITAFVRVVSVLYQQYPKDFPKLIEDKIFEIIKDPKTTAPRRRTILCAYADLIIVHVYTDNSHVLPILKNLIKCDIEAHKFENDSYLWRIISHCGGDLVGVNRGPNTVMDPVFPPKECVLAEIRPFLSKYYAALIEEIKAKAQEGMKAREEAYKLFLQMGKFNTRPDEKAKECKAEYEKLLSIAKKYGFIMKKEPEEIWKNEEDLVEITTPEGPVLIPKRIADQIRPNDQITKTNDIKPLVDINTIITEKLSLDIDGIKKELERAQDTQRVDLLSIYYLSIDSPTNREKVIEQFSSFNRSNINFTHFYARFIANISQKFPDIGTNVAKKLEGSFIGFVNAQNKSQGPVAFSPKLHIAKYISELAMLNVGIESYFTCLGFSLKHFYGKTIDMAITLILTAGKFLDDFCDATHIRIRKAIDDLKVLYSKEVYQQQSHHHGDVIKQAIELFEKPDETIKESKPLPSLNKYQAYLQYILLGINSQRKESSEVKKLIERLWKQKEVTQVTQTFVISQILDLENYSLIQLSYLARLISEFSKTDYDFAISVVDTLLERIRRGIERDSFTFRQRQILEVKFLAELVNSQVIHIDVAFTTAMQILSLNLPNPKNFLICVVGKKEHKIQINPSDFFKVKMVCEMIESLLPTLRKFCTRYKQNKFSYTPSADNSRDFNAHFVEMLSSILFLMQLFCLVRNPIPIQTAFDISDLIDKLEYYGVEGVKRYQSLKDKNTKEEANSNRYRYSSCSKYAINPQQQPTIQKIHDINFSDDDSSNSDSDIEEELFKKELNEVKEEFRQEARGQNPNINKKINIPIELMSSPAKKLEENEKMTIQGPPIDFSIAVPKGDKTMILSFSKDEQPKPQ